MKSLKYIYYFKPDLSSHIHFFQAWVEAVRDNDIPMELVTFLSIRTYSRQFSLVKKFRSDHFHIYPDVPFSILEKLYFFCTCLFYKKNIIHLKKRSPLLFDTLKKIFPKRLIYIFEGEGDPLSELDYLLKHPYKESFYQNILEALANDSKSQKELFTKTDYITFGNLAMKNLLIDRYPGLGLEEKIILNPMSFKRGSLFFSLNLRNSTRNKLGLSNKYVLIYIGNAFYSWQNVFRTIEIFKLVKNNLNKNSFLILLINRQDFNIVEEFIDQIKISPNDYLLSNVTFDLINEYLNASDLGVVLRHKHIMNEIAPSGKILDYLGSGLPIITTSALGELSIIVRENKFGVVLENMDDDDEVLREIVPFLEISELRRKTVSEYASKYLSTDSSINEYVNLLKKISNH